MYPEHYYRIPPHTFCKTANLETYRNLVHLKLKSSQVQWYTFVVPVTQEAEVGGILEFRSLRPAWATE
jgi:hypothetical protein